MSNLILGLELKDKTDFLINDTTLWTEILIRSEYNLHLIAERYSKSEYVFQSADSTLGPALAIQWTVKTEVDGSYRLILIGAKSWSALLPYLKNSVVSDEGKLFITLQDTPVGTNTVDKDYFKEVKKGNDIDLLRDVLNGLIAIKHHLHDNRSQLCLGEKAIAYAGEKCGCTDECETIKDWAWSMIFHQAATYAMTFGEFEEAGKFIDNVNARCGSDSSKLPCNCG